MIRFSSPGYRVAVKGAFSSLAFSSIRVRAIVIIWFSSRVLLYFAETISFDFRTDSSFNGVVCMAFLSVEGLAVTILIIGEGMADRKRFFDCSLEGLAEITLKRGENGSSRHHMLSRFPGSLLSVEKLALSCHVFCQFFHPVKGWTRKRVSLVSHSFHHSAILSLFPVLIFPTSRPLSFKTGAISSPETGSKAYKIRIFRSP